MIALGSVGRGVCDARGGEGGIGEGGGVRGEEARGVWEEDGSRSRRRRRRDLEGSIVSRDLDRVSRGWDGVGSRRARARTGFSVGFRVRGGEGFVVAGFRAAHLHERRELHGAALAEVESRGGAREVGVAVQSGRGSARGEEVVVRGAQAVRAQDVEPAAELVALALDDGGQRRRGRHRAREARVPTRDAF